LDIEGHIDKIFNNLVNVSFILTKILIISVKKIESKIKKLENLVISRKN